MKTVAIAIVALLCICAVVPAVAQGDEEKVCTLTGTVKTVVVDDVEKTQLVVPAEGENEEPTVYTIVATETAAELKAALKEAPDAMVTVKCKVDEKNNLWVKSFEVEKQE